MAYIKSPDSGPERVALNVKIDSDVNDELDRYCLFIKGDRNYVLTEILRKVFEKDQDFQQWRKSGGAVAAVHEPKRGRKRSSAASAGD